MNWGAISWLQRFWDIRAACNFIGGGGGSSLVFWAALGLAGGLPYTTAALTGMVLVGGGLFMVWLEIGKPWRALNVFFRPQTSWMTREGLVALPLFALGLLAVLIDAKVIASWATWSPIIPAMLAAIICLVFLYCQLRILNSARGLPAWREPRAMPLLGLSGLCEGLAIYLLLNALLGIVPMALLGALIILLAARAMAWHTYVAALARAATPESTMTALINMRAGFLIVGHLLPAILIVSVYAWPGMASVFLAVAGIVVTLAGWWFKVILVTKAAYIPATAIPHTPVRGRQGPPAGIKRTT